MSLVEALGKAALSQMTKQASSRTGLSEQAAAALLPIAGAILMNGLEKNVARPGGAEALAKALVKHDGGLLNDLSRVGNDDVVGDGRRILGHILGGKQGKAEAALAKAAGVKQDQVGSLLAMAAPAILASLGKAKAQGGLDAGALAGLVRAESAKAAKDAPPELNGLLKWIDADGDGNVVEDIAAIAGKTLGGLFKKH